MTSYVVLERAVVQDANCIAGFTYGFPAITHFLGYTHALSRKLSAYTDVTLTGCAVVAHSHELQINRKTPKEPYRFALTRNPLGDKGESMPMVEEGRMRMTISLVIELSRELADDEKESFLDAFSMVSFGARIAGGRVVELGSTKLYTTSDNDSVNRGLLRSLTPGFILTDRTELLKDHLNTLRKENPDANMLDAWCDFASLTYNAEQTNYTNASGTPHANWVLAPKPYAGYLVPIVVGYKAISPLYDAGTRRHARDLSVPFCLAENAYGIGQWISPHRVDVIDDVMWRYSYEFPFYLCRTKEDSPLRLGHESVGVDDEELLESLFELATVTEDE